VVRPTTAVIKPNVVVAEDGEIVAPGGVALGIQATAEEVPVVMKDKAIERLIADVKVEKSSVDNMSSVLLTSLEVDELQMKELCEGVSEKRRCALPGPARPDDIAVRGLPAQWRAVQLSEAGGGEHPQLRGARRCPALHRTEPGLLEVAHVARSQLLLFAHWRFGQQDAGRGTEAQQEPDGLEPVLQRLGNRRPPERCVGIIGAQSDEALERCVQQRPARGRRVAGPVAPPLSALARVNTLQSSITPTPWKCSTSATTSLICLR